MSNASDHVPWTLDPDVDKLIRVPGDLGEAVLAPDGVMRVPVETGTALWFTASMVLPRLWIKPTVSPTSLPILLDGGLGVFLACDGDDTPHIWGRDVGIITINQVQFVDSSNGGSGGGTRLFDMVALNSFSFWIIKTTAFQAFKFLGTMVDGSLIQVGPAAVIGSLAGFVIRATPGFESSPLIESSRLGNFGDPTPDMVAAAYSFIGGPPSSILSTLILRQGKPANSFLFIDSANPGSFSVTTNHYLEGAGFGSFFRPDVVDTLTNQADVSIATSAVGFTDSAVAPGVDTSVEFDAIVDVKRGDVVLISGEAAYDGAHTVVRVAADLLSYDINVVHSTSGQGSMDIVEHTVDGPVRFVEGETVTITGTTSYNATVPVFRKTSDTTFTTSQAFVLNDATGTASSAGRDQTSPGVIVRGNAEQENSQRVAEAFWNANVAATTVADGSYSVLSLTGFTVSANSQRFILSDDPTGEITYIGEAPTTALLRLTARGSTGPSTERSYRLAASIDQAVPAFGAQPYSTLDIAATSERVELKAIVHLDPGQDVRVMVAGDGTTTAVVFSEGQLIIEG